MKRQNLLTILLSIFFVFVAFHGVHAYAQAAISGDEVCGKWDPVAKKIVNPCGITSLKIISQKIFTVIISLGLPLLVVFIIYRFIMAWFAAVQGNENAYHEAAKKVKEAVVGFIIIVAIAGGITLTLLKYIGVKDGTGGDKFNPLQLLQGLSIIEIPRAYAAASVCAPPNKGDTCFFTGNGTKQVGNVTDSGSSIDLSKFCSDPITGLTSNTDRVNNSYYWRDQTDCTGKINGTVCDQGTHVMGICSSSYTPPDTHFKTGPVDCVGKLPDTFCTPTGFTFGIKGGTCVSRNAADVSEATCYPASTGVRCLSSYNEGKVGTTDMGGTPCIVVGDPCTQSNGKPGVFAQKPQNIFCVDPSTVATVTAIPTDSAAVVATAPTQLPNPLGFNSLYDFILGVLSAVMKFFLYPALICIWVWAGFLYVAAQGAPEKLVKAHKLLFWAVISTLIVFMAQGFLMAIKGSVDKMLPAQTTTTASPVGTPDGRGAPAPNTFGASCQNDNGVYGTIGADNVTCITGGAR